MEPSACTHHIFVHGCHGIGIGASPRSACPRRRSWTKALEDAMNGPMDEIMDHTMASSIDDAVEGPMNEAMDDTMASYMVPSMVHGRSH